MKLSDRIRLIISENGLKQKEFAQSIQVTESYISKLLRDESGVSHSTATLIEERYSYSAAIGLFNNLINFILLVVVNKLSKKLSGSSLW